VNALARGSSLPPPHDPGDRVAVAWAGRWEVRQFAGEDARLAYFRSRGFHHLQLWHPGARISILTPSRLTAGRYEAWPEGSDRFSAVTWRELASRLESVELPGAVEVLALESWFVTREEPGALRLLRLWWRAPRVN
jgi:hypothetical protein